MPNEMPRWELQLVVPRVFVAHAAHESTAPWPPHMDRVREHRSRARSLMVTPRGVRRFEFMALCEVHSHEEIGRELAKRGFEARTV